MKYKIEPSSVLLRDCSEHFRHIWGLQLRGDAGMILLIWTIAPNGFVFAFLGDRKLYRVDLKGHIIAEIILGESKPIPEPYKIQNPGDALGGTPHIIKMEHVRGHLLVLMDGVIWIVESPSFKAKKRLLFEWENADEKTIHDFSASDDWLYLRVGYRVAAVPINENWFN